MMETSSVLPRKSTAIFGNLLKMAKTPSSVCLYNKKNITPQLEDTNFMFSLQERIAYSFAALTREILFLPLEHQTTSSRFLFLKSSACGTLLILCKLGKETRREAAHHSPLVRSRFVRSIALKTLGKERDCSQSTRT